MYEMRKTKIPFMVETVTDNSGRVISNVMRYPAVLFHKNHFAVSPTHADEQYLTRSAKIALSRELKTIEFDEENYQKLISKIEEVPTNPNFEIHGLSVSYQHLSVGLPVRVVLTNEDYVGGLSHLYIVAADGTKSLIDLEKGSHIIACETNGRAYKIESDEGRSYIGEKCWNDADFQLVLRQGQPLRNPKKEK